METFSRKEILEEKIKYTDFINLKNDLKLIERVESKYEKINLICYVPENDSYSIDSEFYELIYEKIEFLKKEIGGALIIIKNKKELNLIKNILKSQQIEKEFNFIYFANIKDSIIDILGFLKENGYKKKMDSINILI